MQYFFSVDTRFLLIKYAFSHLLLFEIVMKLTEINHRYESCKKIGFCELIAESERSTFFEFKQLWKT